MSFGPAPTLPIPKGVSEDKTLSTVENYNKFFSEGSDAKEAEREANYATMVNAYYDLVTEFYEYGWGESFHFFNILPKDSIVAASSRHQHILATQLALTESSKKTHLLDLGCGIGGPMREISRFTKASITGVNNNDHQIQRGNTLNKHYKLDDRCRLEKGDFMALKYEPNSFDGVYAFEATCHAPDLVKVYSEAYKVLKPGARFACYEWVMTDNYDPKNPEHVEIYEGILAGDSLPKLVSKQAAVDALKAAGFELITAQDLAEDVPACFNPWYSTLQGSFSLEGFRMSRLGRTLTDYGVRFLEAIKIAPAGSHETSQVLMRAAHYLVLGGEKKIFTPMFMLVGQKPLKE